MSEDPTPAPSLPTAGHPTRADFELADRLKKECLRIVSVGDSRHRWDFDEQLAAAIIGNQNRATQRALADCVEALKALRTDYKCVWTDEGGWSSAFDNLPCVKQADDALAQAARITGAANGGAA